MTPPLWRGWGEVDFDYFIYLNQFDQPTEVFDYFIYLNQFDQPTEVYTPLGQVPRRIYRVWDHRRHQIF